MALTWNDLFLSGSVVDLNAGKWRARSRIKAADLGITDSDAVDKALALGTHRLAPTEAFEAIDEIIGKVRRSIDYYSCPFGFIRGARYVPEKNLAELGEKLRGYRADFDAAVKVFVDNYETIKAQMLPVLEQALRDAARSPEAASAALDRLRNEYPSAAEVAGKFALTWSVYAIQGPRREGAALAMQDESSSVRDMLRGMVTDLRGEVKEKLADTLELISKGGKLQARSIQSAMTVLDHVEAVNIFGDEVLSAQIASLRRALQGLENQRVSDAAMSSLTDIKQALEADIEQAVESAEKKLTAVGKRKLKVA